MNSLYHISGKYLFPELFGQPKSRGISAAATDDAPATQPQQEER
jgi:hypothetical protein